MAAAPGTPSQPVDRLCQTDGIGYGAGSGLALGSRERYATWTVAVLVAPHGRTAQYLTQAECALRAEIERKHRAGCTARQSEDAKRGFVDAQPLPLAVARVGPQTPRLVSARHEGGAMADCRYVVQLGAWAEVRAEAAPIRFAVFVAEQKVPADTEIDAWDEPSLHALARDAQGRAVGTGRLLPAGRIGRMAVLAAARGQGAGGALLRALIEAARGRGCREVILSAQTHAIPFYGRYGFVAEGDVYLDAQIPHRQMRRLLVDGVYEG